MAETQQKRLREESHVSESLEFDDSNSNSKRQKPYTNILSLLDEEEEEEQPSQDLSAIFTTLQQELSSSPSSDSAAYDFDYTSFTAAEQEGTPHQQPTAAPSTSAVCADEDEGVKSVMRHLLEASDDELGIPNTEDNCNVVISSDENFPFAFAADDGLWEFDDVAANYYTMLQTELFM
ncbi:uncharacterized protein LOC105156547 [Sesamum indicum]|uniref:Uncharacterized protein LOC105156547 n=1 Tax=Sesamum indicum TaxID=4182 RepID=A0A6I9SPB3_SESIN|nr:uncharacterized protein LOC105156547 [Sesamum indicum]